jgi:uncharacterized membrane protein
MERIDWQKVSQFIYLNRGKIIGGIIGCFLGILLLIIGFFKTILILSFTLIGYFFGSRWDRTGKIKDFLDKILPPFER